jgi:hypothetical protein
MVLLLLLSGAEVAVATFVKISNVGPSFISDDGRGVAAIKIFYGNNSSQLYSIILSSVSSLVHDRNLELRQIELKINF